RGFAGAVRPDDGEDLVLADPKADLVQRLDAAKGEADPVGVEDSLADAPIRHQATASSRRAGTGGGAGRGAGVIAASRILSSARIVPRRPSSKVTSLSICPDGAPE